MRAAITICVIIMIALAEYLILAKDEITAKEARKQQVEQALEEAKDALQAASDSMSESVTAANDAAKAMATEWQSDMEDAFTQANDAVVNMSEEASLALHDAVNAALDDAAVVITERSEHLEATADAVRQELRFAIDRAVDKAAQDLDLGHPMEIDALVGSVQELGKLTDTRTPAIDTVLALIKLRGKVAGLY